MPPEDELLAVLFGCGCRKRCCCGGGEKREEGPAPSNLFQTAPRTRRPPEPDDESPFVPPPPSFDSPQRPGLFGSPPHTPRTDATTGEFLGEVGGAVVPALTLIRDDGTAVAIPGAPRVDHQARTVTSRILGRTVQMDDLAPDALLAPPLRRALDRSPEDRLTPFRFELPGVWASYASAWLEEITVRPGGYQQQEVLTVTQGWDGRGTEEVTDTLTAGGQVARAVVKFGQEPPRTELTRFRVSEGWAEQVVDGIRYLSRYRTLQGYWRLGDAWPDLWSLGVVTRRAADWGREAPPVIDPNAPTTTEVSGPLEWQVWDALPPLPAQPPGLRWRSPDGRVTVEGPDQSDPADLTESTLTAYGSTLGGGTWAALRDVPVQREDGTWEFDRIIVLHEAGGTVTAVRPGGIESCTRAVFEEEVLRVSPGTFQRFSPVGSLFSSWPPPWAFALVGTAQEVEARALVAGDAWRDAIKRKPAPGAQPPAGPASWYWPARPGRRPKSLPTSAPRSPLGVTLADVLGRVEQDEPLPRGEAPLRLPSQVEVWKEKRWEVSTSALTALAKRTLYAPAGWLDELDDRTSVRLPVRITWAAATGQAVLLLRAKPPSGKALEVTVNGTPYAALKLGHNAPEKRGWHPYVVVTRETPPVLVITANAPLSRVLRLDFPETVEA